MPAPIITTVPSHIATMLAGNSEIRRLGKVTRNARLGILPESPMSETVLHSKLLIQVLMSAVFILLILYKKPYVLILYKEPFVFYPT